MCRSLDVEAFVDPEVVAACVMAGVPPIPTSMTSAATAFIIVHADDHDVVRAHFASLEEAEACAAVKKPRTAALRAETKTAWDE